MRDNNLKSANFFNAAKYPTMIFKSTSIINTTGIKNMFKVTGNLTMHGVTKSVTVEVWFRRTLYDVASKKTTAGFQILGTINRADFLIGPADPFDTATDVAVKADGEFIEQ